MKRQNIVPILGILACILVTLVWGFHSRRENERNRVELAPALPQITSDTQPMTIDEMHLRFKRSMDSAAPGHYALSVDKDAGVILLDEWADGFDAAAVNAALRSREHLVKWQAALESLCGLGQQMQDLVDQHGHPELSVVVRMVNCDDYGQIFAAVERGGLTYDVVADTPPGEEVPDPTARVAPVDTQNTQGFYIVNTNSGVFHLPGCAAANQIADYSRQSFTGDRADLIAQGFHPCGRCNP